MYDRFGFSRIKCSNKLCDTYTLKLINLLLNFQASDVLAVELLQKDTRLAVTSEHGKPCPGGT